MNRSNHTPNLARRNALTDFGQGLSLPFRAFGLILVDTRLRRLSFVSGAITGVALLTMAVLFWPLSRTIAIYAVTGESMWWKGAQLGIGILAYVTLFVVGALTVPNIVLAPLGDLFSEATEVALGDVTTQPFTLFGTLQGTFESLRHTFVRLFLMIFGTALLWPMNLLPVFGGGLWIVSSSLWSMFWISVEHLSTPMARHLYSFPRVVSVLLHRLPLAIGLGAALWVLLWIPVINFFLLPVAIVAGTLLFRGLLKANALVPKEVARVPHGMLH